MKLTGLLVVAPGESGVKLLRTSRMLTVQHRTEPKAVNHQNQIMNRTQSSLQKGLNDECQGEHHLSTLLIFSSTELAGWLMPMTTTSLAA